MQIIDRHYDGIYFLYIFCSIIACITDWWKFGGGYKIEIISICSSTKAVLTQAYWYYSQFCRLSVLDIPEVYNISNIEVIYITIGSVTTLRFRGRREIGGFGDQKSSSHSQNERLVSLINKSSLGGPPKRKVVTEPIRWYVASTFGMLRITGVWSTIDQEYWL